MRAALDGDAAAYRRVLADIAVMLRGMVRGALRRAGQGNADAEDIVQDILLAIHLKRGNWDRSLPFRPWLNAVARYKIIDAFRRRRYRVEVDIADMAETLPAEPAADNVTGDVEKMLVHLTARQRAIVRAVALEERKMADIAAEVGMSEGAVRVALHRALKELAQLYRKDQI